MTETQKDNLRKRKQEVLTQNGLTKQHEEKKSLAEFTHRHSPLTVLIEGSLHIRAIYHIFVVILLILLCDTVIYDFVERGKINIGTTSVIEGFGDIRRGAKIWLLELAIAVAFYPGLRLYAGTRKFLVKFPAALKIWSIMGILGVAVLEVSVIAIPTWDLGKKKLALASSTAVTCEMFRFAMKIHAAAVACAPQCRDDLAKLPTFKHYVYFLFAPTLVYRDEYPRTKKIRWGIVLFHFLEVAAIIFYNSFLWERFILPYWSDYGKEPKVEAGTVVRNMFACVLPGVISFLCGFYCLLHAWHNAFAEMLTFGDRLFYEEWWTTSQFSRYYRAWNRVVYSWLRDHIYRPLSPRAGRALSTLTVFVVSAVAHEVILSLSFGFFYPVLMMEFGGLGLLMLPLTASTGRRFPSFLNLMMWLSFFIGNGLLWSLYPMEYFARKNCPPKENDSFFIPKSWSCPEIVLKPNWSFQNPFNIIY
ncbi:sterol O-acyltransferase 2 [Papilio machaon]|uniref:sterol O-acyltransferase 2 n=1 Tax=Papilio machaon TaxID=76193 RepID=UPI001E6649CA|nr:sterol O-acyltransferase 2 [Papilio machaon]XP_014358508.2 sterol O-acyltransferase 2 [Papilio machaon]